MRRQRFGRLGGGERRGLTGPSLHPLDVTVPRGSRAHRRGEAALHGIGCGWWSTRSACGADVRGGDAPAGATAERAAYLRALGRGAADRVRPRGVDRGLGAAQEADAYLDRARAEDERGGDTAPVGDAARCDHRHRHGVDDGREEREQPDKVTLGTLRRKRSPVGVRLGLAGARQLIQPAFTARQIFGATGDEALVVTP